MTYNDSDYIYIYLVGGFKHIFFFAFTNPIQIGIWCVFPIPKDKLFFKMIKTTNHIYGGWLLIPVGETLWKASGPMGPDPDWKHRWNMKTAKKWSSLYGLYMAYMILYTCEPRRKLRCSGESHFFHRKRATFCWGLWSRASLLRLSLTPRNLWGGLEIFGYRSLQFGNIWYIYIYPYIYTPIFQTEIDDCRFNEHPWSAADLSSSNENRWTSYVRWWLLHMLDRIPASSTRGFAEACCGSCQMPSCNRNSGCCGQFPSLLMFI